MNGEFQDSTRLPGEGDNPQDTVQDQETLTDRVRGAAEHLKQEASAGAQAAKDSAAAFVADKQGVVAAEVGKVSGAIQAAAENLSAEGGNSGVTALFREAAEGINTLASSLDNKSPEEMVRVAEDFARRQPALFFAGATLLGVVAGRFIRASRDHAPEPSTDAV